MTTDRPELPLTTSAGSCSCCSLPMSDSEVAAKPADSDAPRILLVGGMTCGHCVSSVTEEVQDVEGVTKVSVELVAGGASKVSVSTHGHVSDAALQSAIEEAGYEVLSR